MRPKRINVNVNENFVNPILTIRKETELRNNEWNALSSVQQKLHLTKSTFFCLFFSMLFFVCFSFHLLSAFTFSRHAFIEWNEKKKVFFVCAKDWDQRSLTKVSWMKIRQYFFSVRLFFVSETKNFTYVTFLSTHFFQFSVFDLWLVRFLSLYMQLIWFWSHVWWIQAFVFDVIRSIRNFAIISSIISFRLFSLRHSCVCHSKWISLAKDEADENSLFKSIVLPM